MQGLSSHCGMSKVTRILQPPEGVVNWLISFCCGKQKPTMSPLRKQGSRGKNWIPAGVYPAHDAGRE